MSYLVLARKYRPRTFADVKGQDHITRTLVNALKTNRVAHSYLFAGPRGIGKTTVARLLAMALSCQSPVEQRPCGVCQICQEISSGEAVDVYEIDGASNRGIDEIRELRETIRYLPSKGLYKVYIIDEVHMLTPQAFNALLKTLEEPPEHVVFIFATTEAHKVPATILSRCQRYDFKRVTVKDIVERLEFISASEAVNISPKALRLIALESEGSLRDSLSLLDQVIAFAGMNVSDASVQEALGLIDRALVVSTAEALLAGDAGEGLTLLDRVYSYGYDTKDFTAQLLEYFRSLVVAKISRNPEAILELLDAELEEVKNIAVTASLETLTYFFNALLENMDNLRRSSHPRLALEVLIVRLAQIKAVQPLAEITARLEDLLRASGPMNQGIRPDHGAASPAGGAEPESVRESFPRYDPDDDDDSPRDKFYNDQFSKPPDRQASRGETQTWSGFLASVRTRNKTLFSFLQKGEAAVFGPDEVKLVFTRKSEADMIDQETLQALLQKYFNRQPDLKIMVDQPALEGPKKNNGGVAADNAGGGASVEEGPQSVNGSIVDHPLVRQAEKLLKGRVVKVTP